MSEKIHSQLQLTYYLFFPSEKGGEKNSQSKFRISWAGLTALSCSNRSFIFQTDDLTPLATEITPILVRNASKMSPNPWIPQPAAELAVRQKHHQRTQLPRSLERVVGEKLLFRKRWVFLSLTIWLLGLKPVFGFFFFFSSFLNLLARGIKPTVALSCIICLHWPTVIILTHFSSHACAHPSLSKARRPRPGPPAARMHSGMQQFPSLSDFRL